MARMTDKQARERKWRCGDIVVYRTGPYAFGAVVDCDPWLLGDGTPVVHLAGLGPEYRTATGGTRSRVNAASCELLRHAPTEFIDGIWRPADDAYGSEPDAVVMYSFVESPETGHLGWCWWAQGKMGSAESYEQAKLAAERSLAGGA